MSTKQPLINPPKANRKKSKHNDQIAYLICDKIIIEQDENNVGEDAVFCEGTCQVWVHRTCVGLINKLYNVLSESDDPYLCLHCMLCKQNSELTNLKSLAKALSEELLNLRSTIY